MEEEVLSTDHQACKLYKHLGFSSTIIDSCASPSTMARGISWEGTNTLTADSDSDKHYKLLGFSSVITDSYNSPASAPTGISWDGFDTLSTDSNANKFYKHLGFSGTITYSFGSPDGTPSGVSWRAEDAKTLSTDSGVEKHYKHNGFTATILDSYTISYTYTRGISWDLENALSTGYNPAKHYKHDGFSATIIDSYGSPAPSPTGIAWDGRYPTLEKEFSDEGSFLPQFVSVSIRFKVSDAGGSTSFGYIIRPLSVSDVFESAGELPSVDAAVNVTDVLNLANEYSLSEELHELFDSMNLSFESFSYRQNWKIKDNAIALDGTLPMSASMIVVDRALYIEYVRIYLGLGETVGRMIWRFSTAYDKTATSNLTTLTTVLASELTKLELNDSMGRRERFIDSASGVSLDYLGALFSIKRLAEETDRNYKMRIKAVPLTAGGTKNSLISVISSGLKISKDAIDIIDDYKGADGNYGHITIEFDVTDGSIKYDEATFLAILNQNKAAGIKVDDVNTVERHALTFKDECNACHRVGITEVGSLNWVCTNGVRRKSIADYFRLGQGKLGIDILG